MTLLTDGSQRGHDPCSQPYELHSLHIKVSGFRGPRGLQDTLELRLLDTVDMACQTLDIGP